ncbi:type IV secretion system protein [Rhizobium leguminosarum]|uniref:virB8 family protein n=1 Tax=Rhizobium leguminosarum TaxID=384 RepID=UPI001C9890BD|nr:type IV secretion system protein [Rhizobium leguminosarum]MBY5775217.1 type IV secretion system protein [Rhizobium leguminosarum]
MNTDASQHAFEDELFFSIQRQRNSLLRIATGCSLVAILSLSSLLVILPLGEPKPYVVMVDKTTGEAEKLVQVRPATLDQQDAVLQAELVSYVVDRETYDQTDNRVRIPDVMSRSSKNAAETLAETWNSTSSQYPPTVYGSDVRILVTVKSISLTPSLRQGGTNIARVRLTKYREEKGKQTAQRSFVATIGYEFAPRQDATLEMVWKNPLGFNVLAYRIDAEITD